MGNQCLASTPLDRYNSYFENIKTSQIKDFWTTIEVYKIKKLFDATATKDSENDQLTHLNLQQFLSLFPELQKYPERQKARIFELFNFDGKGIVDWNNFFSMISICYFGTEDILAVIMFLIFDQSLSKQLTKAQIQHMCQHNESYIVTKQDGGQQILIYEPFQIAEQLIKNKQILTVQAWLEVFKKYFNMSKFKRLFNIFIQDKLEKDLIKNFTQNNNLYVESQNRYVSYLVDFKWFESWKMYIKQQYGYLLTSNNKKPLTFRTKKSIKSMANIHGSSKVVNSLTLRQLRFDESKPHKSTKIIKQENISAEQIKNFDFIHNNIGEKPKQISNKALQGDYQQVLRQDLIQNRDYILVSDKVWKTLKRVYGAYPEFRRTGFDFIELYPKILRILPFQKGTIKYSQQNIKQVSAYYAVEDILQAILTKEEVQSKKFFYKSIGIKKWQQIQDLSIALAQISSQIIIYIAAVDKKQVDAFNKKYKRIPKDITQINVGDQIIYEHPIKKRQQNMIFLGKNVQGKYILHIPGQSYIYDICVMQSQLLKKAKFNPLEQKGLQQLKIKRKQDLGLIGIPNTKGLGYINSVLIHLYYNFGFKQQLSLINVPEQHNQQSVDLILNLSQLFKDLTNKKKINTKIITQIIQQYLPDFQQQFSVDMCNQFINQFFQKTSKQLAKHNLKDYIQNYKICSTKTTLCQKCNNITSQDVTAWTLSVPLHNSKDKYYQIIYVPYCESLGGGEMKRFGFKLRTGAKLSQYQDAFETVAGLKGLNKKYLLMQIYANNISKNYSTAKKDVTLDELLLRDTDIVVAYELKLNFSDFISKHYAQNVDFDDKQIKIDQFIDCKNVSRGWIFGKVCEKDFTPYGHRTIIRVIHKFSKGQQWQISYDVDQESVANFPTKSYLNGEQYHIRLQQRYFNQASNDMQICNMPLVVVLTNWMRWRQFYYIIYLQMRRFINQELFQDQFFNEEEQQKQFELYSGRNLSSSKKRKTQKIQLNKFKSFLNGPNFPYKLSFVDYSGRCAICFKFLKSQVFNGEYQKFCNGCQLSTSQPISWQIKVADVMVCVDWKKLQFFKKDIVKDHSSLANLNAQKKNDVETLESCLKYLEQGYENCMDQICCQVQTEVVIKQKIKNSPQNLTIFLERIVQQNGFIKISNKQVKFEDTLTINKQVYSLVGLTSIDGGSNKSTKYRGFIMNSHDQWLEYDGNIVRTVKRSYIDKLCVLNLFYKKKQPQAA